MLLHSFGELPLDLIEAIYFEAYLHRL